MLEEEYGEEASAASTEATAAGAEEGIHLTRRIVYMMYNRI
jgi:hypothetical protein